LSEGVRHRPTVGFLGCNLFLSRGNSDLFFRLLLGGQSSKSVPWRERGPGRGSEERKAQRVPDLRFPGTEPRVPDPREHSKPCVPWFPTSLFGREGKGKRKGAPRCTEEVKALHTQKLAGVCTLEQDELARGKLRRQDHPALVEGVFRNHVSGRTPDAPAPIHRSDVHRNVSSSGDQLLEVLAVWQVAELTPPPWTGAAPQGRRMLD
jgi:hypothetical protein